MRMSISGDESSSEEDYEEFRKDVSSSSSSSEMAPVVKGPWQNRSPKDPNSFSRPDQIRVKHMDLLVDLDFEQQVFHGEVTYSLERCDGNTRVLVLDTWRIKLKDVCDKKGGKPLVYEIHRPLGRLGSKLDITLGKDIAEVFLAYDTHKRAGGIDWEDPIHTKGKKQPFVYTSCECIHCRSIVPCQDTPSNKFTYRATVIAPEALEVVMSAVKTSTYKCGNKMAHTFRQSFPIPAYLVALAAGRLQSKRIGPRSRVWAEPEDLKSAAYEFSRTEALLTTAESICGKYIWPKYDILLVPGLNMYAAMENPCMTFVSPSTIVRDRSQEYVIAHEISHSWAGNLVTCLNFEHAWLNEGLSTYLERKIMGKLYGKDLRLFLAYRGMRDLKNYIFAKGNSHPFTKLVVDLSSDNADDAMTLVTYEKGHTFLYYIETLLKNPEDIDEFLKMFFSKYQFKSIDSLTFKSFLCEHFKNCAALSSVDWHAWFYNPGMPPVIPDYTSVLRRQCSKLKNKWINWKEGDPNDFDYKDIRKFLPVQLEELLDELRAENLPRYKLQLMDSTYHFGKCNNPDIRFRWYLLCINNHWDAKLNEVLDFVSHFGQVKYALPIYRRLRRWTEVREESVKAFSKSRSRMPLRVERLVARILKIDQE